MHRETHAALLNTALGRGYKPPSGEVWTADMLKPDYKAAPAASNDKAVLTEGLAKIRKHAGQFSKEGKELRKQYTSQRKLAADRRRKADQMKRDGADPKRIRDFLINGV